MHAIALEGCANTTRDSALLVDCGRYTRVDYTSAPLSVSLTIASIMKTSIPWNFDHG